MGKCDEAVATGLPEQHVVDPNGGDTTAIHVPIGSAEHDVFATILRLDETVTKCASPKGSGTSSRLFRVERFVETIAQSATETFKVGVAERIHLAPAFVAFPTQSELDGGPRRKGAVSTCFATQRSDSRHTIRIRDSTAGFATLATRLRCHIAP